MSLRCFYSIGGKLFHLLGYYTNPWALTERISYCRKRDTSIQLEEDNGLLSAYWLLLLYCYCYNPFVRQMCYCYTPFGADLKKLLDFVKKNEKKASEMWVSFLYIGFIIECECNELVKMRSTYRKWEKKQKTKWTIFRGRTKMAKKNNSLSLNHLFS